MSKGSFTFGWDKAIILLLVLLILFGGMSNELFITSDNVNFIIGDVSALATGAHALAHPGDRAGKCARIGFWCTQQVEGETLSGTRAD